MKIHKDVPTILENYWLINKCQYTGIKKTHEEVPNFNGSYCSQTNFTFFDQTVYFFDIADRVKIFSNFSVTIWPLWFSFIFIGFRERSAE